MWISQYQLLTTLSLSLLDYEQILKLNIMKTTELLEEVIPSLKKFEPEGESVWQIMEISGLELLLKSNEKLPELEELFIEKALPILEDGLKNEKSIYEWRNAIKCFSWFNKESWRYEYREVRKPLYVRLQTEFQKILSGIITSGDIEGCRKIAKQIDYNRPTFFCGIEELNDLKKIINKLFIDEIKELGEKTRISSLIYFLDIHTRESEWVGNISSFLNDENKEIQGKMEEEYFKWLHAEIDIKSFMK